MSSILEVAHPVTCLLKIPSPGAFVLPSVMKISELPAQEVEDGMIFLHTFLLQDTVLCEQSRLRMETNHWIKASFLF